MHICFLSFDYPSRLGGGGVGNQAQLIGRGLVKLGMKVSVIALVQSGLPEFEEDQGVGVYRIKPGNAHWYVSKIPFLGKILTLPVRELEYSWAGYKKICDINSNSTISLVEGTETGMLFVSLRMHKIHTTIRLHGERYTYAKYSPGNHLTPGIHLSRLIQRISIRRVRSLSSPSHAHAREISCETGIRLENITVLPNLIHGQLSPKHNETSPHSNNILFVGRLEEAKGVFSLIGAASEVVSLYPDTHFYLAGSQHPSLAIEVIRARIQQSNLQDHITFLGHIPHEELDQYYRNALISLLPSYYETFGVAVIEAMSYGLPVVAFSSGAIPEIIENGITGILVPPGDTHCLAQAVVTLMRNPELRKDMGAAAKQKVAECYDAEQPMHLFYSYYNSVIV